MPELIKRIFLSARDLFEKTPKRGAWVLLSILVWAAWGGVVDLYDIAIQIGPLFKDLEMGSWPTWGQLGATLTAGGLRLALNLGLLLICFATGWAIFNLFERHLRQIGTITTDQLAAEQRLVLNAIEDCGVLKIFEGRVCPIARQPYAENVRMAVQAAKKIRILSIAAYEFLGRRDESLLFDVISNHQHNPSLEAILLNPKEGGPIIAERVKVLSERDAAYDAAKMTSHIERTIQALDELQKSGRDVKVRLTSSHPGFRLLIADDIMFVSAYTKKKHGHEAHVFQIFKKADATWFSAFEAYYNQMLNLSRPAF